MRYKGRRQSSNVEDRRGMSTGKKVGIRGGLFAVVALVFYVLLGGDPQMALNFLQSGNEPTEAASSYVPSAHEEELAEFISVVLADTEDVWHKLFSEMGLQYHEPNLVLFSGQVQSACGFSSAATGPFYCPGDDRIYIDLLFLEQLQERLGAGGDFAIAYIVSHEVGHHVQKQLGTLGEVHSLQQQVSKNQYNELTVRLELQADFYAGVWAHHAQKMKNILEEGDLEEAFNAAQAVGDDRLQMQSQGYVVPDSFTHGTSDQRMSWFRKGFSTGNLNDGNTFEPDAI
ncbi:neutral zinc metallopeptidase [Mariniphaga sp.]|uniref:KPN_02809 family neutral zinc metallopeptidase n=1 Tax=Mariniphaga sp. TaxID=1954475 RepID=UPI003563FEEE